MHDWFTHKVDRTILYMHVVNTDEDLGLPIESLIMINFKCGISNIIIMYHDIDLNRFA